MKKSKKISRQKSSKKEDHYSGFFLKPRDVFIAGVVVLFLVGILAFTQVKTSQTGFSVKPPQPAGAVEEGSIRNLEQIQTDFGSVCGYDLFKSGQWSTGHTSILSCSDLAKQNNVVQ